jgi:multiple sugar transport system substrate-binding protein
MKIRGKVAVTAGAALLLPAALVGCSSDSEESSSSTLTYVLWDTNQQAPNQACADTFKEKTGTTVKIQQTDYANYWTNLNTQLAAGTGPDVITDVTSYYPDFVKNKQLVDLSPLIEKDKIDLSHYHPVSLQNWKMDGSYYGLPKDVDAVGLVFSTAAFEAAKVDAAEVAKLTWNPTDGGSFETLIRRLTVDEQGHNGLSPEFDKSHVKQYGLNAPGVGDITGHDDWGNLVLASGVELLTPNPFGTTWHFDDPKVAAVFTWYQKMIKGGYVMKPTLNSSVSKTTLFDSGKIAMTTDGSWNAGMYAKGKTPVGWAPIPAGPVGVRTYTNSLADSINKSSKNQEQAWEWVKYLGTPECQDKIASYGVVLPALKQSTPKARVSRVRGTW